jgi:hypothetical protein
MRIPGYIPALTLAAVVAGCSFPPPAMRTYHATVERIEEPAGDYYSPLRGREPATRICLSIENASGFGGAEPLRVMVLDLYKPGVHGRVGDRVLFGYAGQLPREGEVGFDSLAGYRVLPRGG